MTHTIIRLLREKSFREELQIILFCFPNISIIMNLLVFSQDFNQFKLTVRHLLYLIITFTAPPNLGPGTYF